MQRCINFEGQTALVCGGTGRVGSTICSRLAAQGVRVVVQYHANADGARDLVHQIEHAGGEAIALQANVTDEVSVDMLVKVAEEQLGPLHILVNTVHGESEPKYVAEMTWADWNPSLGGLKAQFLLCRAVLPGMRGHHYGRIVYISAGLSHRLFARFATYSTIKAGLNVFCKTLALEEGRYGITVNIVAPGKVVPEDGGPSTDHPEQMEEINQLSLQNTPLGRHATSRDVAEAVLFFASPQASGITGQTLYVAGGEIMP